MTNNKVGPSTGSGRGRPRKDPAEVKQNRLAYRREWGERNRPHLRKYRRNYDRTHPRYFPKPKPPSNSAFSRLDLQTGLGLYIGQFLNAKATLSDRTIESYQGSLGQFAQHALNRWPFDADDINSFLASKKADGCNLTTVHGYYRDLKTFCAWLKKRKKIEENPIEMAEKPPRAQMLPRVPAREDVTALYTYLLELAQTGEWIAVRNLAIFSLMLDAGLRVGEVTRLKLNDVDLNKRLVILRDTKTRSDGVSILGLEVVKYLAAWKKTRDYLALSPDLDSLFVRFVRGEWGALGTAGIGQTLTRLCLEVGLGRITPHQLRHACAVFSLQGGANLIDVQKQLRHKTPQMTLRYLMMNDEGREARHLEYSPLDRMEGMQAAADYLKALANLGGEE